MTNILVIDNYDSFVYTLNGYLQQLELARADLVVADHPRARTEQIGRAHV